MCHVSWGKVKRQQLIASVFCQQLEALVTQGPDFQLFQLRETSEQPGDLCGNGEGLVKIREMEDSRVLLVENLKVHEDLSKERENDFVGDSSDFLSMSTIYCEMSDGVIQCLPYPKMFAVFKVSQNPDVRIRAKAQIESSQTFAKFGQWRNSCCAQSRGTHDFRVNSGPIVEDQEDWTQAGRQNAARYPINRINVDPAAPKRQSYFERLTSKLSTTSGGGSGGTEARPKAAAPPPPPEPRPVAAKFVRQRGVLRTGAGAAAASSSEARRHKQLRDLGLGSPTASNKEFDEEVFELDTFNQPSTERIASDEEEAALIAETSAEALQDALELEIVASPDHEVTASEEPNLEEEILLVTAETTSIQIEALSDDEKWPTRPLEAGVIISAPALAASSLATMPTSPPGVGTPIAFLADDDDRGLKKVTKKSKLRHKTKSNATNSENHRKKLKAPVRKTKSMDAVNSKRADRKALAKAREALAKRLRQELEAEKVPAKKEAMTFRSALEWLLDFSASCVICASFTALVFLIPIVANPALVSLDARFSSLTDCRVCGVVNRVGFSNCSWTSCREGCTADIYKCLHVWVMYNPEPEDCDLRLPDESVELFELGKNDCDESVSLPPQTSSCARPRRARLYINALSCGYPPEVNCSVYQEFVEQNATSVRQCQYSRRDPSLAVLSFDSADAVRTLLLSMFVPVAATALSSVYLCWRFCGVDASAADGGGGGGGMKKKKAAKQQLASTLRAGDAGYDDQDEDDSSNFRVKSKSDTDIPGSRQELDDFSRGFHRRHHNPWHHDSSTTTVSTILGGSHSSSAPGNNNNHDDSGVGSATQSVKDQDQSDRRGVTSTPVERFKL